MSTKTPLLSTLLPLIAAASCHVSDLDALARPDHLGGLPEGSQEDMTAFVTCVREATRAMLLKYPRELELRRSIGRMAKFAAGAEVAQFEIALVAPAVSVAFENMRLEKLRTR